MIEIANNGRNKIKGGWTIWARQTLESDIFLNKPAMWFKIWFYLINKMHFVDNGQYLRGQRFLKYEWITDGTGATKHQIHEFFQWAKNTYQNIQIKQGDSINQSHSVESFPMLTTQKTTRGMVVTICKYEFFQDFDNYETTQKTTQKPHRNHTILKEGKEVKTNKEEKNTYIRGNVFKIPSIEEVTAYCQERNNNIDPNYFIDHYTANGWMRGETKIKDWKAVIRIWEKNNKKGKPSMKVSGSNNNFFEELRREKENVK